MNPNYFDELHKKTISPFWFHEEYYNNQYPATQDCIAMDKQIALIQADIDDINKRVLDGKRKESANLFPYSIKTTNFGGMIGSSTSTITWQNIGVQARGKALKFLIDLLNKKKNQSALMDCRNKIETKRQDETATFFTETAAEAEKRILTQSKSKTFLLIGVSALAILTTLYVLTKNK